MGSFRYLHFLPYNTKMKNTSIDFFTAIIYHRNKKEQQMRLKSKHTNYLLNRRNYDERITAKTE